MFLLKYTQNRQHQNYQKLLEMQQQKKIQKYLMIIFKMLKIHKNMHVKTIQSQVNISSLQFTESQYTAF
jgi:hypothetical protein